jgi:hypothetical protein
MIQGGFDEQATKVIDEHLFIEIIALCAFQIQYRDPQPTDTEKVKKILNNTNLFSRLFTCLKE